MLIIALVIFVVLLLATYFIVRVLIFSGVKVGSNLLNQQRQIRAVALINQAKLEASQQQGEGDTVDEEQN